MAMMQGNFTADGKVKLLEVPFDANWIKIINMTTTIAGGADTVVESYWQQGMDYGIRSLKTTATDALTTGNLAAGTAITKINTGDNPLSAINATGTAISALAGPPVVSAASTAGMYENGIIRMVSTLGAQQLAGMDFTVDNIAANTSFDLTYMPQIAIAGTTTSFYLVKYDKLWYPRNRFIVSMTQAEQAVLQLSVDHDYEVGDSIRIRVPKEFGMFEADLAEVKITAIEIDLATNVNTVTVDLDTRTYTPFAFPAATALPLQEYAEIIALSGPVENVQFRGFQLPTGADAPGGVANDEIMWLAGDSFGI